jgi:predicted TPR repeat methyltransferase
VTFDRAGKVTLDHIYSQNDPRPYFGTLRELEYRIPQSAKTYFACLIEELRCSRPVPRVLDVGCSYGINAALLRHDATMDELYERYAALDPQAPRGAVLAADQDWARHRRGGDPIEFLGLDASRAALSYARDAGFIDVAIHADLERDEPTAAQWESLATSDLVISTGCYGYVGVRTFDAVTARHRPWMAHTVLRMYSYEPVIECLAERGYETLRVDRVFRQRRFASAEEQSLVLDTLSEMGVDPTGWETDGWLYAQMFISRPAPTKSQK